MSISKDNLLRFGKNIGVRQYLYGYLLAGIFALPLLKLPNPGWTFLQTYPQTFVGFWLLLYILILALFAIVLYLKGVLKIHWSIPMGMLLLWAGSRILSIPSSLMPMYSFTGAYGNLADGLVYLLALVMVFSILSALTLSWREILAFLTVLFTQFFIISFLTLHEAFLHGFPYLATRPNTLLYNPDFFLSYGLLLLPLSLWAAVRVWRKKNVLTTAVSIVYLAVVGCALFVTLPQNIQSWVTGSRVNSEQATSQNGVISSVSNTERVLEWKIGLSIFRAHPITGSGAGTTREAFYEQAKNYPTWNYLVSMQNPHSEFIQELSQNGVIGAVAYLAFWFVLIRLWWKNRNSKNTAFSAFLMGGLFLYFVFNQLLFPIPFVGLIFISLVALLVRALQQDHPVRDELIPLARMGYVLVALTLLIGTWLAWRQLVGEQYALKALAALNTDNGKQAVTISASAVETYPWEAFYNDQQAYSLLLYSRDTSLPSQTIGVLRQQAADASNTAVTIDPYSPYYRYTRGMVNYVYGQAGSNEEKSGLKDFVTVFDAMPYNQQMIVRIIQALAAKPNNKDGVTLINYMSANSSTAVRTLIQQAVSYYLSNLK
jgi:hypothetical protein